MEQYQYDETNGLWYELAGDYYIPCLPSQRWTTSVSGANAAAST